MSNELGREIGWEDEIKNDGEGFEVLPIGDYDFEVKGLERGRFDGSEKMAACNKAVLSIRISGPSGALTINHNLMLNTKMEWKICEFYTAIGFRKKGEPLKMAWGKVIGTKGKCKVGIRKWKHRTSGEEMESNEILKFYDPADYNTSTQAQAEQKPNGWAPGRF